MSTLAGYYTTADVADALSVSLATIRAYHSRGQMPAPAATVGRTPLWANEEIDPWIDAYLERRHARAATES